MTRERRWSLLAAALAVVAAFCWFLQDRDPTPPPVLPAATGPSVAPSSPAASIDRRGGAPSPLATTPFRELEATPPDERHGSLLVQVVDRKSGAPRSRVRLEFPELPSLLGAPVAATALTGDDGCVLLEGVLPGEVRVFADRGGSARGRVRAGERTTLRLAVDRGRAVHGVVRDAKGRLVKGASILVTTTDHPVAPMQVAATTDDEGRFALEAVGLDRYLAATADGHGPSSCRPVAGEGEGAEPVVLTLRARSAALSVRVLGPEHTPRSGARIEVEWLDPDDVHDADGRTRTSSPRRLGFSDALGVATFSGLGPGRHRLRAALPGFSAVLREGVVGEGEDAVIELVVALGFEIAGRVTKSGREPVSDAVVTAIPGAAESGAVTTLTGVDGSFVLRSIPAGTATVVAFHPAVGRSETRVTAVDGDRIPWDSELAPGAVLRGKVEDEDGAGMPSLFVNVVEAPPGAGPTDGVVVRTLATDSEGRFFAPNLGAGPYRVEVFERAVASTTPVARREGVRPDGSEVVLRVAASKRSSATVRGALRRLDGCPVASQLEIVRADESIAARCAADPGDGRFESPRLVPGAYRLVSRPPWPGRSKVADFEVGVDEHRDLGVVVHESPGELEFRVDAPATMPPGRHRVLLFTAGGTAAAPPMAEIDLAKRREPVEVAAGEYRVESWREGAFREIGEFRVAPGERIVIPLRLERRLGLQVEVLPPGEPWPAPGAQAVEILAQGTVVDRKALRWRAPRERLFFALRAGRITVRVREGERTLATADLDLDPAAQPGLDDAQRLTVDLGRR